MNVGDDREKNIIIQSKEEFFKNFNDAPDLYEMVENLYPNSIDDLEIVADRKRDELLEADKNSEGYDLKTTKATIISLVKKNKIDNADIE